MSDKLGFNGSIRMVARGQRRQDVHSTAVEIANSPDNAQTFGQPGGMAIEICANVIGVLFQGLR
jgi:hypothetical protein